jgi:2Fe-2S ferredoxin
MPVITIKPSGVTVEVASGSSLLEAILAAGHAIGHKCDGNAECGTCHVFVHEGRKGLSKMQFAENAKLDGIVGVGSKSRLACQAMLKNEDITVELLGFASGM